MQYAEIIVDHRAGYAPLTYTIPPELLAAMAVGAVVTVPLGQQVVSGIVYRFSHTAKLQLSQKLRPIQSVIHTGEFIPEYYLHAMTQLHKRLGLNLGTVTFTYLPQWLKRPQPPLDSTISSYKSRFRVQEYILPVSSRVAAYKKIADQVFNHHDSLLILCPSANAAAQLSHQLSQSKYQIYLYPTGETPAAKRRSYLQALHNAVPSIYIGTRGALATPLNHIGAVMVEEPWLPGHKEEQEPKLWSCLAAFYLCEARRIPLGLVSTLQWPETRLLNPREVYKPPITAGEIELAPGSRLPESLVDFFTQHDHKAHHLAVVYHQSTQAHRCPRCGFQLDKEGICPQCGQTISVISVTKDTLTKEIMHLAPRGRVSILTSTELLQYNRYNAALVLGFDALVSIPDFRASFYLATLIENIRQQSQKTVVATNMPDVWTRLTVQRDITSELLDRRNYGLPPYTWLIRFSTRAKKNLEIVLIETKEYAKPLGTIARRGDIYSIDLLLLPRPSLLQAWQSTKNGAIDILPSYIDSTHFN